LPKVVFVFIQIHILANMYYYEKSERLQFSFFKRFTIIDNFALFYPIILIPFF
jgi:hypothetical protein